MPTVDQRDPAPGDGLVKPCPLNTPTHWLEIELVDEDGVAVADEEFRVVLPSGEAVRGFLDQTGFQRFGPVEDAGQCQVSFPGRDERAVRRG